MQLKFTCQVCGKVTKDRRAHHQRMHQKNMSCDLCGKTFSQKRELADHILSYHMNVDFKCTDCTKMFKSHVKLEKHYQRIHRFAKIIQKFRCDNCDATVNPVDCLTCRFNAAISGLCRDMRVCDQ